MVSRINQLTAAHRLAPAAPGRPRHIPPMPEGVCGADLIDTAKRSRVEQFFGPAYRRQIELVVGTHQRHTTRGYRRPDSRRLVERQAERLLAQDVLSSLRSRKNRIPMQMMRQANINRVDLTLREQRPIVAE